MVNLPSKSITAVKAREFLGFYLWVRTLIGYLCLLLAFLRLSPDLVNRRWEGDRAFKA